MSKNSETLITKLKSDVHNVYDQITIWNLSFAVIILVITALAVYNSINPGVSISFSIGSLSIKLPGDYFYELIFNPLWVIAAFFYERNVHARLEANNVKVGKIGALTLDAAIRKEETLSIKTINKILSDTDQKPVEINVIIEDNELDEDIASMDTIHTDTPNNLRI